MTHREAMEIAMAELGYPAAEIKRRLDGADRMAGIIESSSQIRLQPGVTKRDFIEGLKEMDKMLSSMPKSKLLLAFRAAQKEHDKNIREN